MIVGIPKEIKTDEHRVSMTPDGVFELVQSGNQVLVQENAGHGSGFTDIDYRASGAKIVKHAEEVWSMSEMIVKVKEPIEKEYQYFKKDLFLFTYLHLAANRELTDELLKCGVCGLAYETLQLADGSLPLLAPMSEIAGEVGAQEAASLLAKHRGGKGVLIGGAAGVPGAKVVVLGGGISGQAAAKVSLGMGAQVIILDLCHNRLRFLSTVFGNNCTTAYSNHKNIRKAITGADIVIGCILVPGEDATHLVTRKMLSLMTAGSVVVDIAIDQGGCFETSRPTTHRSPTFVTNGIVHYCVANIPGAVPRTSTIALSNATLPYIQKAAHQGVEKVIRKNLEFNKCLNTYKGNLTNGAVGKALGIVAKSIPID